MTGMPVPVSIWLQPEEPERAGLQAIIDETAGTYDTVAFAPHLTVCSVPGGATALDGAAAYIRSSGLLPLIVKVAAVSGALITPFRAVFIDIEDSPQLHEFRQRLRDVVRAPEFDPPHISLLYTLDRQSQQPRPDFDAAKLSTIAAECAAKMADTQFTLSCPVAVSTDREWRNVSSWRILQNLGP
jgi:hypothetical protein